MTEHIKDTLEGGALMVAQPCMGSEKGNKLGTLPVNPYMMTDLRYR